MTYYAFSGLLNFFTAAIIGLFLLSRRQENKLALIFGVISFATAQWSLFYFLWLNSSAQPYADFYMRTCMIGVLFLPPIFFHFTTELLNRKNKDKFFILFNYFFSACIAPLVYTSLYARTGTPFLNFSYWLLPGPLFHVSLIHFILVVVYSQSLLVKTLLQSKGRQKRQLIYFFIGTMVAYIAGGMNFLCWYRIPIPPFLNAGVSFYVIFLGYGIFKYRLMGIEVFLKRSFSFLALYITTIIVATPLVFILNQYIENLLLKSLVTVTFFVFLIPLILKLNIRTELSLEQLLFKESHDYRKSLYQISKALSEKLQMNELLHFIIDNFSNSLDIKQSLIFMRQNHSFLPIASAGFEQREAQNLLLKNEDPLIKQINQNKRILIEEIKVGSFEAHVIIPVFSKEELTALCCLGKRGYQYSYTTEDVEAFETFSNQLAIALDNAKAYKEIEELNFNLEKKVKQRSSQLIQAQKLASIGQLVAGIAHHINNKISPPIQASSVIKRNLDAIVKENKIKSSEELQAVYECLGIIKSDLDVVKTIVNDLLISSHQASLQFQFTDLNLNKLLKTVVRIIRMDCLDRVRLHEEYDENLPIIRGDLTRLEDVFMNLMKNSLDAIPRKGNIWIKTWQDSSSVFISFRDDGTGIAQENMDKIFDFFFTTKDVGSGTGLGLSVSYATVKEHRGDIIVTSEPNHGTEFVIQLPKMLTEKELEQ